MPLPDRDRIFESFLSPSSPATHELASCGADAIPVLESLLTGEAKNAFGHPYRELGAMRCGLVTARLLGSHAKPLERLLREALRTEPAYAAAALGALRTLELESIVELARCLATADSPKTDWDSVSEAAAALCRCGAQDHPAVMAVCATNGGASRVLNDVAVLVSRNRD